jgi:hypothetical protein
MDAMVAYLVDAGNAIAGYLDTASVRASEYINKKYTREKGEALVSCGDVQTVGRANYGNRDETYPLMVSLGLLVKAQEETSPDLQAALTVIREELNDDFQANNAKLWSYYDNSGGEVLSVGFMSVDLGSTETLIAPDSQNCTLTFNVFVRLTRDTS